MRRNRPLYPPWQEITMTFPIFNSNGKNRLVPMPTFNNSKGVIQCWKTEERKDFRGWARDPYTGKLNLRIKDKEIRRDAKEWKKEYETR